MEASRVEGHALIELGAMMAKCECGVEFGITEPDAKGRSVANLKDQLMDRHSNHLMVEF